MFRYKAIVFLHFTKQGLNHSGKYTFWGDTMEEIDWHIQIEIDDMESNQWELREEKILSCKQIWQTLED